MKILDAGHMKESRPYYNVMQCASYCVEVCVNCEKVGRVWVHTQCSLCS